MKKNFSVLVTGSCGFIGKNLLEGLSKKNLSIIGTYRFSKNFVKNAKVKYIKINTCNFSDFNNIKSNPKIIVHSSNKVFTSSMLKNNKKFAFFDNVISIINLLKFCKIRKVKKLIYISSSTGYPKSINKLKEKDYFLNEPPIEHYLVGTMSRILERIIFMYKKIYNLDTKIIIIRPSAIYGKYDDFRSKSSRLIPHLIKKIIVNKSFIKVPGSGLLVRNWVNVSEFTNLIIKLIFFRKKKTF